ncbi:MAG TPA: alpha/beta fold hydrolase [Steroidobacteraceae bacterium]|nr:alpha/beta fold hydrolase [Steroidobacteraceae bacterium]
MTLSRTIGLVGLLAIGTAAAEDQRAVADDAAAFGALEAAYSAALSADGKRVVFVGPGDGKSTIAAVIDLATGTFKQIARANADPASLRYCNWTATDRLVCSTYGLRRIDTLLLPIVRTVAMDADGGHQLFLGERDSVDQLGRRQFDGYIVDWMNGADGTLLMARSYIPEKTVGKITARILEGMGVDRMDTRTGKATLVERPGDEATDYISDGLGTVRIMTTTKLDPSGYLRGVDKHFYRLRGDRHWRELGTYVSDGKGIRGGSGMIPLAVDPIINAAYVKQPLDGRYALYRVMLDGSLKTELVFASKEVDVDDVVRIPRGGRVIGARYTTDRTCVEYFDSGYKAMHATLERALPGLPLITFVSVSADENIQLVSASSDVDPGRWYVFDRSRKTLGEAIVSRPALQGRTLSTVRSITYPAADGTQIPAYLTLPPGVTDARNLPAIVLPHGGPASRDEWGFGWLPQFFAQRGFAVLQPNYRGSLGYGDRWFAENGFRGWRTSIGDVCDAGRWLLAQGIADPSKLAVFGWSYGGYAALQANVLDADLFKAVIAVAPVSDLALLRHKGMMYASAYLQADYIGSGPHIKEGSPAQNAAIFKAPVLMFHGDKDLNVDIDQSRRMDKALRNAGKSTELIVYHDLDHDLIDGTARADMLRRSEAFFREHLKL